MGIYYNTVTWVGKTKTILFETEQMAIDYFKNLGHLYTSYEKVKNQKPPIVDKTYQIKKVSDNKLIEIKPESETDFIKIGTIGIILYVVYKIIKH